MTRRARCSEQPPTGRRGSNRVSIGEIAAVWFMSLQLVGCAKTMPNQESVAAVRVTTNPVIPRGCVFVGGTTSNDSIEDLQRKAARLGGNVAFLTMEPPRAWGHRFGTYFMATVFRCDGAR
jgi:hypothetical protein